MISTRKSIRQYTTMLVLIMYILFIQSLRQRFWVPCTGPCAVSIDDDTPGLGTARSVPPREPQNLKQNHLNREICQCQTPRVRGAFRISLYNEPFPQLYICAPIFRSFMRLHFTKGLSTFQALLEELLKLTKFHEPMDTILVKFSI